MAILIISKCAEEYIIVKVKSDIASKHLSPAVQTHLSVPVQNTCQQRYKNTCQQRYKNTCQQRYKNTCQHRYKTPVSSGTKHLSAAVQNTCQQRYKNTCQHRYKNWPIESVWLSVSRGESWADFLFTPECLIEKVTLRIVIFYSTLRSKAQYTIH